METSTSTKRRARAACIERAACIAALLTLVGCATTGRVVYQGDRYEAIAGYDKKALVVPVVAVDTRYRDNTRADPDTAFADSALMAVANAFLRRGSARYFTPLPAMPDSIAPDMNERFTTLESDSGGDSSAAAAYARRVCEAHGAKVVVVPYTFYAGFQVHQGQGWRRNTGPAYARPVEETGSARMHVQVWRSDGNLLFERVGSAGAGKPMLYGWFNGPRMRARRQEALEDDAVKAAGKLYAPPILRAVGKAVDAALLIR
ncbi:MAG: hypothetical protein GF331_10800 [Chitinivibrionales bacterium]|nr:hypothetical protein [Chitinivibrionales bacterium]